MRSLFRLMRAAPVARALSAALPALLLAALPRTAAAAGPLPQLRSQIVATGLTLPVAFEQDPSDPAVQFVVEQGGRIRVLHRAVLQATPFLDLSGAISAGGERGLLGLAFAPDYAVSRRFFVNFTNPDGHTVIARFLRSAVNPLAADPSSRFDLRWGGPSGTRFITQPFANHNGGDIHFGPDRYLYIALGDGGSGGDPNNLAQNPNSLLGKMLRIDVGVPDADPEGYVVPPDNPFVDSLPIAARPEIWSFGWRNPWRFSFDDPARGGTGAMYIGDVGQSAREEIDYEPAGAGGRNYGWRNFEGRVVYNNSVAPAYTPLTAPMIDYDRSVGTTVIGGVVNRRSIGAPGDYVGRYFYADFTGRLWSAQLTMGASGEMTATDTIEHTAELSGGQPRLGAITAFGLDWQGVIHFLDYGTGRVLRVVAATPVRHGARSARIDFDGDVVPDIAVFRPGSGQFFVRGIAPVPYGVAGDIPVPGFYTIGLSTTEAGVFRPSTGQWFIQNRAPELWGAPGDVPVPGRYRLTVFDDIAVFRPATGEWFIKDFLYAHWGAPGDIPVPADYDGDGLDEVAVYRPATGVWYVRGGAAIQWGAPGDIPVPADFDADGLVDVAVFRPSTGQWLVRGKLTQVWGAAGDVPVPLDFDSDFRAELVVFRPSTGVWHIRNVVTGEIRAVVWGAAGDVPLGRRGAVPAWRAGDGDGDRRADLTVVRPSSSTWFTAHSVSGFQSFTSTVHGLGSDTPVAGDFDGDGRQDIMSFRPANGRWSGLSSASGFAQPFTHEWGIAGDLPVVADYDGDGRTDVAVFRPSLGRWFVLRSSNGAAEVRDWGLPGDVPRPADFDGDGRADLAVFRPSLGRWFVLDRFTGTYTVRDWGLNGDVPLAADFDGDRRADLAVFRPPEGRWYVLRSSTNSATVVDWGLSDDVPMPLDFDGDGRADTAIYRPATGRWYVRGSFVKDWGLPGDVAVPSSR